MICKNCQTNVADGVKFCTNCGNPIGGSAPGVQPLAAASTPQLPHSGPRTDANPFPAQTGAPAIAFKEKKSGGSRGVPKWALVGIVLVLAAAGIVFAALAALGSFSTDDGADAPTGVVGEEIAYVAPLAMAGVSSRNDSRTSRKRREEIDDVAPLAMAGVSSLDDASAYEKRAPQGPKLDAFGWLADEDDFRVVAGVRFDDRHVSQILYDGQSVLLQNITFDEDGEVDSAARLVFVDLDQWEEVWKAMNEMGTLVHLQITRRSMGLPPLQEGFGSGIPDFPTAWCAQFLMPKYGSFVSSSKEVELHGTVYIDEDGDLAKSNFGIVGDVERRVALGQRVSGGGGIGDGYRFADNSDKEEIELRFPVDNGKIVNRAFSRSAILEGWERAGH